MTCFSVAPWPTIIKLARPSPDSFGGKEFWENLFRVGLIKKECPVCHRPAEVSMYKSRNWVPQAKCPEHGERSCLKSGFFEELKIKEPAKFVHFALTYTSRMSSENSQMMAGLADDTLSKYLHVIEEGMDEFVKNQINDGEMLLGGDGKVVEIDEKLLTINKSNRGRIPPKISILGLVEVDAPIERVEDVRLRAAVRREVQRAVRMGRMRQTRRDLRHLVPDDSPFDPVRVPMEVVDGHGDNETVRRSRSSLPGEESKAIEECLEELSRRHDQAKNGRPRKALFFYVPDRSRETLIPIIQRFVRPGSMVFTDEFATYMCLG